MPSFMTHAGFACRAVVLVAALSATACGKPDIPHPVDSTDDEDCRKCHIGRAGAPACDHNDDAGCVSCHEFSARGAYPELMPHVAGDEARCAVCHTEGTAGAARTAHIAETDCYACHGASEHGSWPPAVPHAITSSEDATCMGCHTAVVHGTRESCTRCHGT